MWRGFIVAALTVISSDGLCETPQSLQDTYRTEIVLERNVRDAWQLIDSRLILDQGDRVRFRIRTNYSGYLYVTNRNTSGGYEALFPGPEAGLQNKLEPGREYIVPANAGWFRIAGPPGQEIVYWLLSPVQLPGLEQRRNAPADTQAGKRFALAPRCDSSIFKARGDCIDTSAGPRELKDKASLPEDLAAVRNLTSRDLVFIRQNNMSIVYLSSPLDGPLIYEFRLAHR